MPVTITQILVQGTASPKDQAVTITDQVTSAVLATGMPDPVTGAFSLPVPFGLYLQAQAAGDANAAASVATPGAETGGAAGGAAATGTLTQALPLSGTASGGAGDGGTASRDQGLAGGAAGAGTGGGAATTLAAGALAGSAGGKGGATAAPTVSAALAGSAAGKASDSAGLAQALPIAGAAAGTGTGGGTVASSGGGGTVLGFEDGTAQGMTLAGFAVSPTSPIDGSYSLRWAGSVTGSASPTLTATKSVTITNGATVSYKCVGVFSGGYSSCQFGLIVDGTNRATVTIGPGDSTTKTASWVSTLSTGAHTIQVIAFPDGGNDGQGDVTDTFVLQVDDVTFG